MLGQQYELLVLLPQQLFLLFILQSLFFIIITKELITIVNRFINDTICFV